MLMYNKLKNSPPFVLLLNVILFREVHLGCDMSFLVIPFYLEKGTQKVD
jgi:hypothetical protein